MKKEIFHKCPAWNCKRKFKSKRGLASHSRMHKPAFVPPPAPPLVTVMNLDGKDHDSTYSNARGLLDIGDTFYRIEKHVITELTITEGLNSLRIKSKITRSHWQKDKPE